MNEHNSVLESAPADAGVTHPGVDDPNHPVGALHDGAYYILPAHATPGSTEAGEGEEEEEEEEGVAAVSSTSGFGLPSPVSPPDDGLTDREALEAVIGDAGGGHEMDEEKEEEE